MRHHAAARGAEARSHLMRVSRRRFRQIMPQLLHVFQTHERHVGAVKVGVGPRSFFKATSAARSRSECPLWAGGAAPLDSRSAVCPDPQHWHYAGRTMLDSPTCSPTRQPAEKFPSHPADLRREANVGSCRLFFARRVLTRELDGQLPSRLAAHAACRISLPGCSRCLLEASDARACK